MSVSRMVRGCMRASAAAKPDAAVVPAVPAPEIEPAAVEEADEDQHRGMSESQLRAEAVSIAHLMTHFPKNPYCPACRKSRLRRKAHRRHEVKEIEPTFGNSVTMDHVYAHSEQLDGLDGSLNLLVVYDIGAEKIDAFHVKPKSADDTH